MGFDELNILGGKKPARNPLPGSSVHIFKRFLQMISSVFFSCIVYSCIVYSSIGFNFQEKNPGENDLRQLHFCQMCRTGEEMGER